MTKKDYQRLAAAFAASRPGTGNPNDHERWQGWNAVLLAVALQVPLTARYGPTEFINGAYDRVPQ
jgi:hypothetical protein